MMALNLFKHNHNIKTFSAGEAIFQFGQRGDEMYVVQEGTVEIRLGKQVIEVVEAGGILGEMAIISSPTRTATAIAITNCRLVPVKAEQFHFMIQETPYFAEWLLGLLVKRIEKMNQRLFANEFSSLLSALL
jgi:CRP/FNR family cyclic AMP-dependent transcriptional regulator